MLTLAVMTSEVVGRVDNLSPEHVGKIQHFHVGFHFHRLQGIYVDLEIAMIERFQIFVHLRQTLLYSIVHGRGRKLGLDVNPQARIVVEFSYFTAYDVAKDDNVLQFADDVFADDVGKDLKKARLFERGSVELQENYDHRHCMVFIVDHDGIRPVRHKQVEVRAFLLFKPENRKVSFEILKDKKNECVQFPGRILRKILLIILQANLPSKLCRQTSSKVVTNETDLSLFCSSLVWEPMCLNSRRDPRD